MLNTDHLVLLFMCIIMYVLTYMYCMLYMCAVYMQYHCSMGLYLRPLKVRIVFNTGKIYATVSKLNLLCSARVFSFAVYLYVSY